MKFADIDKAWEILVSRKAERKENRPAFIAALLMERVPTMTPKGDGSLTLSPHMAAAFAAEFVRLAGAIHSLCEAACNYELSQGQESRLSNLEKRFVTLADALGFEALTGGDPRGSCASLIDARNPNDGDGWGNGWAVYS
jgi:hypothetical protein